MVSYEEEFNTNKTKFNSKLVKHQRNDSKQKQLDNNKRLQTLQEKLNREKSQLFLVNESINCQKRVNKRIVFDSDSDNRLEDKDNEETNSQIIKSNKSSLKSKQLFESDSDSDNSYKTDKEFEFNLNKKISDKNAEKLIELNSRFAHDLRFKIDQKFLDLDDNQNNDNYEEVVNEKEKNLQLLEEVLGTKVRPILKRKNKSNETNDNNNNSELFVSRFDPNNKKSSVYEMKSIDNKKVKFDNKVLDKEKRVESEENVEKVSKEVYYEVSSALKDSLANRGEEFSLTQIFGNETKVRKTELNNEQHLKTEKISRNKSNKNLNSLRNPFRYDSSSSDDEEETDTKVMSTQSNTNRMSTYSHKFFFSEKDTRFSEDLFYRKDLVEKAKNDWKERQLLMIKALALRKRSAKKNIKSNQKRLFKSKNTSYKRFKS